MVAGGVIDDRAQAPLEDEMQLATLMEPQTVSSGMHSVVWLSHAQRESLEHADSLVAVQMRGPQAPFVQLQLFCWQVMESATAQGLHWQLGRRPVADGSHKHPLVAVHVACALSDVQGFTRQVFKLGFHTHPASALQRAAAVYAHCFWRQTDPTIAH